ncbi:hypothetical protein Ahy_A08g039235 [Arachis hypogaea]|uniref:Replication protein A 70 kDa DNA-binding subunit B/D first OB fold domain-containing protein n=1 Tax=Arachis hypogaea TaxID=3818 RepID=A0A445BVN6_ARAHY|nr:hypothetical protein Ahy_A08g039235 [Arachis hypogaea]
MSLTEGEVYLMTHFMVVPNTGFNRVAKHWFRLLFQYKTSVVFVISVRIPHSGLCFISIDEIDQRTKDNNFLIGSFCWDHYWCLKRKRCIIIWQDDQSSCARRFFLWVQCNMFGNACDMLEYDNLQKYPRSPLIVLEGVMLQNVMNVSRLFINPDIPESVEFLSRFSVASYGFSRLVINELRYLVSKVDGDFFNPKEISNIQDLCADNGDGHYFVIGTIKEVMDEPDSWYYSCVCGHAVVEHEDLYLCDACGSCIEHVMVKYGIWVKIHHGGCAILFVLLDNAATKLFGKTYSEAFLRIEEEFSVDPNMFAVRRSYSPHMFDDVVGEEKIFKVEINSAADQDYSGCFKIVNVFSHNPKPAATDDYINILILTKLSLARLHKTVEDIITYLISPNRCYSDDENWFLTCLCGSLVSANKNILSCDLCQLQCIDAVPRFCLKIVVSHANCNNIFVLKDREVVQIIKTRCSSFLDNHLELNQGSYCKVVPLKLISSLLHKNVVFMVDARPVGYEMNRSVYIVQQIWDDVSVINVFEAAAEMNEHKTYVLVDSMPEVEDAFSQCGSDHEALLPLSPSCLDLLCGCCDPDSSVTTVNPMSLTIDALGKISPWKEAWSIEAKILTIWEDAKIVNENMQKFLHMVLIDQQHHKIQATVEDDLITTFIHHLKKGDVFIISDFKVIPNGGLVRVTRHWFCIFFKCSTSVIVAASTVIHNPGLSLTSMDQILQKRIDYEYLIDFVGVLCGLKRKSDVECNGKILKIMILEVFADGYGIASHHFSRLRSNEGGDLVSVIDDEYFDWKLIRTIDNLKGNNEMLTISFLTSFSDGQFFVVGKIKEIVEDLEWWVFSCICSHPIVGDDNVFHCQLCSREVQHFMIMIKILVEDETSCEMFVLLDSAATKLLGRTCSDVFLLLEDEMDRIEHQYCPQFFHQLIGKEIFFKVQVKRISTQGYCGTFKVINVISNAPFFNKLQPDQCIKDQICFLIGEIIDVLKHQKWWYYCCLCDAPVCHVGNVFYCYLCRVECVDAIRRYHIKIIFSYSNGSNIFIVQDDESTDNYTVLNSFISHLMNKKIVFIVDPRPVGYELNTSLHIVRAICDDIDIVKFLEDSTHDNQQQDSQISFE